MAKGDIDFIKNFFALLECEIKLHRIKLKPY